jgi:hypothetical protein
MSEQPLEGELITLRDDYESPGAGRPRMYDNPAQFDEAVHAYYAMVVITPGEPLTLTGMCLFMGFSGRQAFENYASYPEFLDSVTRAKTLIQYGYEKTVLLTKNTAAARLLGAMDEYWNPTTKVQGIGDGGTHEDRLAHLR